MAFRKNRPLGIYLACLWSLLVLFRGAPAEAQGKPQATFAVKAQASAVNGDFLRARNAAVSQAMKLALEKCLREILGDAEYESNPKMARNFLPDAERYVRSYRFLRAQDDVETGKSEVDLEVTLFIDAVRRKLGAQGVIETPAAARAALILIGEKSLSVGETTPFWDANPVSEKLLAKNFAAAGIHVIDRDAVRGSVKEETVRRAAKGDIGAAVDLGQKTGADIVVVGNAISTPVDDGEGAKTVQVSMSLKAISSLKARFVAARSDFASARKPTAREAEAEAFDKASKKLGDFLAVSIQRFWNPGLTTQPDAPAAPPPTDDL